MTYFLNPPNANSTNQNWISWNGNWRRKNLYGPWKIKRNSRLACTNYCQTNMRTFRFWKLLLTVHSTFLKSRKTIEWSFEKGSEILMDKWMPKSLWWTEEMINWRTCINDAGPNETIPNWNWHIKIRSQSCPHPIRFKWGQTSHFFHLKNPLPSRTELRNIWSRIINHNSSIKKWRHYIQGSTYTTIVLSDHKNLIYYREAKKLNRWQAQWSLYLLEFDVKLVHTPRNKMVQSEAKMVQSDAQSQRPDLLPKRRHW